MGKRKGDGAVKKKVWGTKQVLASPFATVFPSAAPGISEKVLAALCAVFPEPFAKRVSVPRPDDTLPADEAMETDVKEKRPWCVTLCKKPPRVLCGLNEVTRALERGKVELAVVCRDVVPSVLIAHLPVLCYVHGAALVVLPGGGTDIGAVLGTRRLLAFAVLKQDAVTEGAEECASAVKLLEFLKPLATELDYPWLAAAKGKGPVPALPEPVMQPHGSVKEEGRAVSATGEAGGRVKVDDYR